MLSIRRRFVFILTLTGLLWLPAGSRAQDQQRAQEPAATTPAELAQVPPGHFAVTYLNGELTITARNAPLGEVLRAICGRIGAELDAQSDAGESVLGVLGPGPAKLVIASLLSDARVNYVIKYTADDPNVIAGIAIFPLAQELAGQPQGDSAATAPAMEKVSASQLVELLEAGQAQLASGAAFDTESENKNDGGVHFDMAAALQGIEEQLKAAAEVKPTAQAQTQARAAPPDSAQANLPLVVPRSHRHRGRH